jgi:putative ATP-dependent endonuclease of OLD family
MKLVSFAVRNYRSILSTTKLPIRESLTVLIGPNNEGKSNVLRALVTALEIAGKLHRGLLRSTNHRLFIRQVAGQSYNWATDFPIALQVSKPNGKSEFDLELELTDTEVADFKKEVRSTLNGTLPIRISIGQDLQIAFEVRKRGPGSKTLSAKKNLIANFIGQRIQHEHIPAVRQAETANRVVEDILERELRTLNQHPDYLAAVQRIEALQQPVLASIAASVRDTLKVFLPKVKDVQVNTTQEARFRAFSRSCEVIVDDGSPTPLSSKGDGVQSLAALSLLRHASQRSAEGKQLILALEEPESHLHPSAIHELRRVLIDISALNQVIITTHCPLFVDRHDVGANILVTDNHASCAESVGEIRKAMGVRVSDNLLAAEVLLLVEGEEDRICMRALLSHYSSKLAAALRSGVLAIDTLGGGSNLTYKLTQAREAMCNTHSLMDHDASGKLGVKKATEAGLLDPRDLTYTSALGMNESELEDLLDATFVVPVLVQHFGVPEQNPRYTTTNKKWSDRVREVFISSGKPWDASIEMTVKARVADAVSKNPAIALLQARRTVFESLVQALEQKLARRSD